LLGTPLLKVRYAKNGGVAPGYAYGRIVTLTQQWL